VSISCQDDTDRPETVSKLRGIGASLNKPAATLGETITVTYYWAGPSGKKIEVKPYVDAASSYGESDEVKITQDQAQEVNYGPLSVYSITAEQSIPTGSDQLKADMAKYGTGRLRHGIKVEDDQGDSEILIGDILVVDAASPLLEFKSELPLILSSLKTDQAVGPGSTVNLSANITPNPGEAARIGWFVSSGKIKNRRARETDWSEFSNGAQTVIVTARGRSSGSFSFKAIKVNAN
jgi:hypothetical protein